MIVDHNPRIRELEQRICDASSATVIACEDGRQAMAAYPEERPDWVRMDMNLPGVGGLAITRELTHDFPEARVILLGDADTPRLRVAAAQAGASGYLTKDRLTDIRLLAAQERPEWPAAMVAARLDPLPESRCTPHLFHS